MLQLVPHYVSLACYTHSINLHACVTHMLTHLNLSGCSSYHGAYLPWTHGLLSPCAYWQAKAAADKESVKARQAEWDAAHPKGGEVEDDDKPVKKKQKTDMKAVAAVTKPAAAPVKPMTGFEMFQAER